MSRIDYDDKVTAQVSPLPTNQVFRSLDANIIKASVNAIYDADQAAEGAIVIKDGDSFGTAPLGVDPDGALMVDSSPGEAGQFLKTNGPNALPAWTTVDAENTDATPFFAMTSGNVNGVYREAGENDGRPMYTLIGGNPLTDVVAWSGTFWGVSVGGAVLYRSFDDVADPSLCTAWELVGAGAEPLPSVSRLYGSTVQQVVEQLAEVIHQLPEPAINTSGQVWIDPVHGDDATGLPERMDKPYKTLQAAVDATSEDENWNFVFNGRPGESVGSIVLPTTSAKWVFVLPEGAEVDLLDVTNEGNTVVFNANNLKVLDYLGDVNSSVEFTGSVEITCEDTELGSITANGTIDISGGDVECYRGPRSRFGRVIIDATTGFTLNAAGSVWAMDDVEITVGSDSVMLHGPVNSVSGEVRLYALNDWVYTKDVRAGKRVHIGADAITTNGNVASDTDSIVMELGAGMLETTYMLTAAKDIRLVGGAGMIAPYSGFVCGGELYMSGSDMMVTISNRTKAGSITVEGTGEWYVQVVPVLCEALTVRNGGGAVSFYDASGMAGIVVNVSGTFLADAETIYADNLNSNSIVTWSLPPGGVTITGYFTTTTTTTTTGFNLGPVGDLEPVTLAIIGGLHIGEINVLEGGGIGYYNATRIGGLATTASTPPILIWASSARQGAPATGFNVTSVPILP